MPYKNKKAQSWSFDLAIACVIFMIGIITLYFYAINYTNQAKNNLDTMLYEGNIATEIILSESYPGILSNNKINQTKINEFNSQDYNSKKRQLNLNYDFYFTINDFKIDGNSIEYIGKMNLTKVSDKIKITRFTIYENKPVKMEFYVWRT